MLSGPKEYHFVGGSLLEGGLIQNANNREFDSFAPRYGNATGWDYTRATLRINDDVRRGRITCELSVLTKQMIVSPTIRFKRREERWNPVNRREGLVWLLGIERFSVASLKRGPTKAVYGTANGDDPYTGFYS